MPKKMVLGFILILTTGLAGCSTTPRKQEVAVSPVVVPQAPAISAETQGELDRLKQQVADEQAALAKVEDENRVLQDKLIAALEAKKPAPKRTEDSYLK